MPSGGTAISAGLSLVGINEGRKASKRAAGADAAALELQAERDRFNREQVELTNQFAIEDREDIISRRDRARGLYDPLEEQILERAQEGPDYEGAMARSDADVTQAFDRQRGMEERRRQRFGVNPSSGRTMAEERRLGTEETAQRVMGRQRARDIEDDRDWARKLAAMGMGNIRNATPTTVMQQLGVSGEAGAQSQIADQYRADASGAFQFGGTLAADAINYASQAQTGTGMTRPTSSASTLNTWRTR